MREQTPSVQTPTTYPASASAHVPADLGAERWELLRHVDELLDAPMIALSFAWLVLMIVDLTRGLGSVLQTVGYLIWGVFVAHFLVGLLIAPNRRAYLRHNWLTAVALVLPAFRLFATVRAFRLLRLARATRSASLARVLTSLNRGMRAINAVMGHRGIGYVVALTTIVTFGGAAGMDFFESPAALANAGVAASGQAAVGLNGYGEALWWTAMTMTTMGSDYSPQTLEGRILGWLLAVYAFAIFGYITATIASLFVLQDTNPPAAQVRPDNDNANELASLRQEIQALRSQLSELAVNLAPEQASARQAGTPSVTLTAPSDGSGRQ